MVDGSVVALVQLILVPERLRADARANRDQILAAARALFAERGADVPIKDIADRAGVGSVLRRHAPGALGRIADAHGVRRDARPAHRKRARR